MAGAVAQASVGRFHVAASLSYDGSKAVNGGAKTGHYGGVKVGH
jgi:hypothetical protein